MGREEYKVICLSCFNVIRNKRKNTYPIITKNRAGGVICKKCLEASPTTYDLEDWLGEYNPQDWEFVYPALLVKKRKDFNKEEIFLDEMFFNLLRETLKDKVKKKLILLS